jgi:hypothetical protein
VARVSAPKPRSRILLRLLIGHGLAYPIATAWAFGSVPALVIGIASQVGLTLDDQAVAHRVLVGVAWPAIGSFVLTHVAALVWGLDSDEQRGRRRFFVAMALLGVVPVVLGGASWVWLMTR